MARSRSNSNYAMSQPSNGGIIGSGIFGSFGTFINCKAEDNSMYCNFMKFFNVLLVLLVLLFIAGLIFLIYTFLIKRK